MITKLYTLEEFKELFTESLLNKTNKISKVSDGSVVNGMAFGNAKLAQKLNKEIAIVEGHIFPNAAYGSYLDEMAVLMGVGQRFGARQSSTYVLVFANPGTTYIPGEHVFSGTSGILFDCERIVTIGSFGYGYIKVRSQSTGASTNVDPFSITSVTNPPDGHQYCLNEYRAQYGADVEEDEAFRKRINEGPNVLARGTLAMLEQVCMKINENVLKLFYTGRNSFGRSTFAVLSINGIDFTAAELADITLRSEKFLTSGEMRSLDGSGQASVEFINVNWQPIDISIRLSLEPNYRASEVRQQIQLRLSKYLDYRFWRVGQRVEWDNMLEIVKSTEGVQYVNDEFFYPRLDVVVPFNKLPRIRGFRMLDKDGVLIQETSGEFNPIYYPNQVDFSYIAAALQNL